MGRGVAALPQLPAADLSLGAGAVVHAPPTLPPMTSSPPTADRLLDAQVAWVMGEVTGDRLLEVIERDVDELLDAAADVRLSDAASPEPIIKAIELVLASVPASEVVTGLVQVTADQLHDGPSSPIVPADLVDRGQVAALVDAALRMRPLVAQALDRLTESPQAGTLAARFVTRLVVDVLEANRSMAKKIPGVGSIVSLGTNAATRMVGVADKQVQALLGDTAGKGTAMAVRRLNSVVMTTLEDPTLRDAVLEVWDTWGQEPFDGVGDVVERDDVRHLAAVLQDIASTAAPTPPAHAFVGTWIRTVFELHGDTPVGELLVDLGITRDDVLVLATTIVPPLVDAAVADGRLEAAVRARLEPFFRSPQVAEILSDA